MPNVQIKSSLFIGTTTPIQLVPEDISGRDYIGFYSKLGTCYIYFGFAKSVGGAFPSGAALEPYALELEEGRLLETEEIPTSGEVWYWGQNSELVLLTERAAATFLTYNNIYLFYPSPTGVFLYYRA